MAGDYRGTVELGTEFVVRAGRRKPLSTWILVLAAILIIAIASLADAINQPSSDTSGGAGHVVIPFFAAVFSALGLAVVLGQWWEDVTFLTAEGDRLRVRHGTTRLRGRSTWFGRADPLGVSGESYRGTLVLFLDQAQSRVRLGDASVIVPLQSARLQEWLRAEGFTVERHWESPAP